ncbi:putative ribonuclease H-like domain-containing protein [Senna tora]|uniref:Putative ribonuclease H-like domain-containing protein n=1 Tax=Senna tora TaxID=362788 RepID=A0A834SR09_9FABA|nr:putative ribonuclease H-like domain-containing protein [Senna tora]
MRIQTYSHVSIPDTYLFAVSCWLLWKRRNDWIFNSNNRNNLDIIPTIDAHVRFVMEASSLNSVINFVSMNEIFREYKWNPPDEGWIKFNTDGSYNLNSSDICCGGVARDYNGNWIAGFLRKLGRGDVLSAKLWGTWFTL